MSPEQFEDRHDLQRHMGELACLLTALPQTPALRGLSPEIQAAIEAHLRGTAERMRLHMERAAAAVDRLVGPVTDAGNTPLGCPVSLLERLGAARIAAWRRVRAAVLGARS